MSDPLKPNQIGNFAIGLRSSRSASRQSSRANAYGKDLSESACEASRIALALGGRKVGSRWMAHCPAHDDRKPSLSIKMGKDGKLLLHCYAGCSLNEIAKALGLSPQDLFPEGKSLSEIPPNSRAHAHTRSESEGKSKTTAKAPSLSHQHGGITLADYSAAKSLPVEFLSGLGLRDFQHQGKAAVAIPYLRTDGRPLTTRYRIAISGDRFRWRSDARPQLYGLWRLEEARKAGHIVIVEGESDCHTAWYYDLPAVGLPGAANWRDERDAHHLDGIDTIYVVIEADKGGEAVLKWLATSAIRDRVRLVDLVDYKDLSDLHVAAGGRFHELWQAAVAAAVPLGEAESRLAETERKRAFQAASRLIEERDILSKFSEAIVAAGVVGETKTAKLIYLALTSRFFSKPISVVLKGPSSAGKSYTSERVLEFFPDDAYYALTAMSEHALAYSDKPLEHRFIVIFEAAGLESDFASYLLRSLLSEGRVRYETVEKTSEGMKPRLIERKGPTGCLLTTTVPRLHPENETRMLSVNVSDSREQTRAILDRLAKEVDSDLDLGPWRALQTWLKYANHFVTIPYAQDLALLVPAIAVRLRRDFRHVLTLIESHAVLHQATRNVDGKGRIIATLDDYAAIHGLIADIVAEGIEATVRPEVRETVEAVEGLLADGRESVTVKEVAEILKLDASTVSRRVSVARSLGYLRNEETRRGMPAKLAIGDRMPKHVEVLPHPDRLRERVHKCASDRGDYQDQDSPEPMVESVI